MASQRVDSTETNDSFSEIFLQENNNECSQEKLGWSKKVDDCPVGNVNNFMATPPGYNGKKKQGLLVFNASFESGNLGRVDYISDFEYDLFIRPDTCNSRFRVWFYFTVENIVCGQKIIFNIVNFSKTRSLYRDGMSPLVKSTSRPRWQRIPAKNVFYYRSPDHRRNYVMSFAFAFDKEDDTYSFAYCYPYTYNRLKTYLINIERRAYSYFKREQLCLTVQQRRVDLLTITSNINAELSTKKKVVFLTARVHPGETPSSYVCQGIIDFLISNHPMAEVLRDSLVFKIVPMLNPDGVVLGNYRSSLMGFDLNRYWLEPSPWAHPSIVATKQLLLNINSDPNLELDFYIDLHAHSTQMNGFMYGNIYEDGERYERESVFPKLLCSNAEDFSFSSTSFNKDVVKAGTGRRALSNCLANSTHCYTLEVSFYSYSSVLSGNTPYTEEGYYKLGRNVARTFLDYYKLNPLVVQKMNQRSFLSTQKTLYDRMSNPPENSSGYNKKDGKIVNNKSKNGRVSLNDSTGSIHLRLQHKSGKANR